MKKTDKYAAIRQYSPETRRSTNIERRVWADGDKEYVIINGCKIPVDDIRSSKYQMIHIYYNP